MIQVQKTIHKSSDGKLQCSRCLAEIRDGDEYLWWNLRDDFEEQYIWCWRHNMPTINEVSISIIEAHGYQVQRVGPNIFRVNRIRGLTVLNPATPSYITNVELVALYNNPVPHLITDMLKDNLKPNKFMPDVVKEEMSVEVIKDNALRKYHVLKHDRKCSNCGVSEKDMVRENPRYTLCRGVCVRCYRRMFRKKGASDGQVNGSDRDGAGGQASTQVPEA